MKKTIIAAAAATVIIAATMFIYSASYPIAADNSDLAEQTAEFLNRGNNHLGYQLDYNMEIYDSADVGKTRITLAEINQELSLICTVRGLNGRYKIDRVSTTDGNFYEETASDGDRKYLLLGGRNTALMIGSISAVVENRKYELDVPARERFLVCTEVDANTEDTHIDIDKTKFYGGDGADITAQVRWN